MKSKWPDFLFTLAVRFVTGAAFGAVLCVLVAYRRILRAFSQDHIQAPLIWLAVVCVAGGPVAIGTTPRWQTPWYQGIQGGEKAKRSGKEQTRASPPED